MRTITIAAILALLLVTTANAEMSARDATALVKEYVAADTTDKRRESITTALAKEPAITAQKGLKDALKADATRPLALDLAIALKCPGLFDSVKKLIDGDDEDKIVKLGLLTGDKGAAEFLADRWAKVETDSVSFGYLQAAFTAYPVELKAIQKFKDALKGDRKVEAGKIVAFQFGAESDEPVTLASEWPDLEAAYKLDSQAFEVKGTDVFVLPTFKSSGMTAIGANYRAPKGAEWSVEIPEEWNSGDFTLTVRIRATYAGPDKGAKFSLAVERGGWELVHRKDEWFAPAGSGTEYSADYTDGEWGTLLFTFTDRSTENAKLQRTMTVTLNGKQLLPGGQINGKFKSLMFVSRDSACVIGGVEFAR
jgi:hypothetical protein